MSEEELNDDLLAPPSTHEAIDIPEDEISEGKWRPELGVPDTKQALRIWLDSSTGQLTKVRLSPRWRERLGSRKLSDAFAEAFLLANALVELPDQLQTRIPKARESDHGWEDRQALFDRSGDLLRRADELAGRDPQDIRWPDLTGVKAKGSSSHGYVQVSLSVTGLTDRIEFDREWLARAKGREIASAVLLAHQRAFAKHTPATYVPGEHDELAADWAQLAADLESMMSKELP